MTRLFLFLAAAATAATLAGLVDGAALLAGGSGRDQLTAAGAILLAVAWGSRRSFPPSSAALSFLLVGGIGWLLAKSGPTLAPFLSAPRLLGPLAQLLLAGFPATLLSARLTQHLRGPHSGLALPLLGAASGWTATVFFGLGALGFGLAAALAFALPVPSPAEKAENSPLIPVATRFFLGGSLAAGWIFLVPLLALFDGHAAPHHGARWLTAGLLVCLGASLAPSSPRLLPWLGSLLAGLAALGWHRVSTATARLEDDRVFNMVISHERLLGVLGKSDRLSEANWEYTPWLLLLIGGLALAAWGAAAALAWHGQDRQASSSGPFFLGAGVVLLLCGYFHPQFAPWRGALAVTMTTLAAGSFLLAISLAKVLRSFLAASFVAGLLFLTGFPPAPSPPSSIPFFDIYQYAVKVVNEERAEMDAANSRVRVVTRQGQGEQILHFLLDGRTFLDPQPEEIGIQVAALRLAQSRAQSPSSALLIGAPVPALLPALAEEGVSAINVSFQPPELLELALHDHPEWNLWRNQISTGPVSGAPLSKLVFLSEPAPWRHGRFAWHPGRLTMAASRVAKGGVLAILMDPRAMVPGCVGAIAAGINRHFEEVELWILPDDWRTPQLLLLAGDALVPTVNADAPLLRLARGAALTNFPRRFLSPPLPRMVAALAPAEFRLIDPLDSVHRAHSVLEEIAQTLGESAPKTILPFLLAHLNAQVYEVRDTLPTATPAEKVEVSEVQLDILWKLAQENPKSPLLVHLWETMAVLLVEKREVAWCHRYFPLLLQDLGWARSAFHVAAGRAALEMLEPQEALSHAQAALRLWAGDAAAAHLAQDARNALNGKANSPHQD